MKLFYSIILFIILSKVAISQVALNKDFVILNNNDTIFGEHITNIGEINPKEITFKSTNKTSVYRVFEVKRFTANGNLVYDRHEIKYQQSAIDIANAKENYSAETKTETVWLKLLYAGNFSLLEFKNNHRIYFFIEDSTQKIEELVYRIKVSEINGVIKDEQYKNKLLTYSKNPSTKLRTLIENSKYERDDLIKIVALLNNNSGIQVSKESKNTKLEVGIGVGYYQCLPRGTSYSIPNYATIFPNTANYSSSISFKAYAGISFSQKQNTINHWQPRLGVEFQTLKIKGENLTTPVGLKEQYAANLFFIKPQIDVHYFFSLKNNTGFFVGPFFQTAILLNSKPVTLTAVYSNGTVSTFNDMPQLQSASFGYGLNAGYIFAKNKLQLQWNRISNISKTTSPILSLSGLSITYSTSFIKQ